MAIVASVVQPYAIFTDRDGEPLEDGNVYIGTVGLNPLIEANRVAVYADAALTIPIPQPVKTIGGAMVRSGSPTYVYVAGNQYSILITDKRNTLVYSALNAPQNPQLVIIDSANIKYDQTAAEIAAAVVPTDYQYPPGDLRRYGGDPTNTIDSSAAWASAIKVSAQTNGNVPVYIPGGCAFKLLTGYNYVGANAFSIRGDGKSSQIYCDGDVLTATGGASYSFVDNFSMFNITAPWIVSRDPNNLAATIPYTSLVQSNIVLGYQPAVNDFEYATWLANIPAIGAQQIGPVIKFSGAANDITISRIYGRFVRLTIQDAIFSTIQECEFRGGRGVLGTVQFDNTSNNVRRGRGNRAINNRISYGSYSAILFTSNDDFEVSNNHCGYNGESGVKTDNGGGLFFTASVGGATAGTLSTPWGGTTGSYQLSFADGSVRTAVLTNGNTAVNWVGAIGNEQIWDAAFWLTGTLDPRNVSGVIVGNVCNFNYYDGLDVASVFLPTTASRSYHTITGNSAYLNRGTGINMDGQFNTVVGNTLALNGANGIWAANAARSTFKSNNFIDNNQQRNISLHDIVVANHLNLCDISDNYVYGSASQNNYGIYAAGTTGNPNFCTNNKSAGNVTFFTGNTGVIVTVDRGNLDLSGGQTTTQQSFIVRIVNTAGTLQHAIAADSSFTTLGRNDRINAAAIALTNTPTGADGATAMAAGAKIGSASPSKLWFDTAAQLLPKSVFSPVISYNSTGNQITVEAALESININGVTRSRLKLQFFTSPAGANFDLTTANIPAGKEIRVQFQGELQ